MQTPIQMYKELFEENKELKEKLKLANKCLEALPISILVREAGSLRVLPILEVEETPDGSVIIVGEKQ